MKKVIVNADDFGISIEVNRSIFNFMRQGRVTSATIIANGPEVVDAVSRSREFPTVSFGVHLNASDFFPLVPSVDLSPIINKAGSFRGNRLREIKITKKLRNALFAEWSAQIQRLIDFGINVSHIDSHYHLHTLPGVLPVIKDLQRRFRIKKVRSTMNIYSHAHRPRSKILLIQKFLWIHALRFLKAKTTDSFTSLEVFCEAALEKKLTSKTIELMVHPGNKMFARESYILSEPWEYSLPFQVQFINYFEL